MNILAYILVGTIAFSLGMSYPMMSIAQEEEAEQIEIPLNFTLKAQDGDNEELNATEAKEVTVTLSVQGAKDGSPIQIPVTAKVANDTQTQDLEFCTTLQGGEEMCSSLEEIVQAAGENQTNGTPSNESSDAGGSTDENDEGEDN
ncbi:MAG TPA: hypothetical protein VD710_06345 [Nitrososphaeraceae archaeon]|nr:hypothetical protein [Nitrososphaeraceae archaeon]